MSEGDAIQVPDLSGIQDPSEPAPEGRYMLECMAAETKLSKAEEAMASFQFRISGDNESAGKYVFDNCMMEGGGASMGLWRLREYAVAMGQNPKKPDVPGMVGKFIEVELSVESGTPAFPNDSNRITTIYGGA